MESQRFCSIRLFDNSAWWMTSKQNVSGVHIFASKPLNSTQPLHSPSSQISHEKTCQRVRLAERVTCNGWCRWMYLFWSSAYAVTAQRGSTKWVIRRCWPYAKMRNRAMTGARWGQKLYLMSWRRRKMCFCRFLAWLSAWNGAKFADEGRGVRGRVLLLSKPRPDARNGSRQC